MPLTPRERFIRSTLARAGRLTPAQRDQLRRLLPPVAGTVAR